MRHPRDYARNRPGNGNASTETRRALFNEQNRASAGDPRQLGSFPSGVALSIAVGRCLASRSATLSTGMPNLAAISLTFSEPRACWICSALIGRFGPVDTHDLACWP